MPRAHRSIPCVALLAFVAGCSEGPTQDSTLEAVRNERGLVTYRYRSIAAEPPAPEVATTLTVAQLRQQQEDRQERRRRSQEQQADDAARARIRRDRERETLLSRLASPHEAARDRYSRRLEPPSPQVLTLTFPVASRELDDLLQKMQRQQEQQLQARMQHPRW